VNQNEMIKRLRAGENPIDVSIRKWEDGKRYAERSNANFMIIESMLTRPGNCALCFRYYDLDCEGCPVYKRTGYTECSDTPYVNVCRAIRDRNKIILLEAIDDEIEFLKSLKEDEENGNKK